jgi:diamine N-acetyltransferase
MIRLEPLTLTNWEQAVDLAVEEDQQAFLPSNLISIAQSKFEPDSEVMGIYKDQRLVGMLILAKWSGLYWITRLMIDRFEQGNGYGSKAIELAVKLVFDKRNVKEVRTTVAKGNTHAEYVFVKNGFEHMGQLDDKEVVLHRLYKTGTRF